MKVKATTVNPLEMLKFSKSSQNWFKENGEYDLLKRMNPVRVDYIRQFISGHGSGMGSLGSSLGSSSMGSNTTGSIDNRLGSSIGSSNTGGIDNSTAASSIGTKNTSTRDNISKPFSGLNILDMGCGGGFLSASLLNLGAKVTGIDANSDNINQARLNNSKLIDFQHSTAEQLSMKNLQFDHVCALEIIEHVQNPKEFIQSLSQLVKSGGFVFVSTINRTWASFVFTILMAENLLNWVPKETHTFEQYKKPVEMQLMMQESGLKFVNIMGMGLNPITKKWSLTRNTNMNYIMVAQKE